MRFLVSGFLFLVTGFAVFGEVHTAPLNDIPGTAHVVTNVVLPDVAAIVTNEVEVASKWVIAKASSVSGLYTIGEPYFIGEEREVGYPEWAFYMQSTNSAGWLEMDALDYANGGSDATYLSFNATGLEMRKETIVRNALGLAMAKDAVSASTVTNIVRDNIGTVWDSSLGVAWQARMHNGHLYYIATTNQPPEVK